MTNGNPNPNVVLIVVACALGYVALLAAIIAWATRVARRRLKAQVDTIEDALTKAGARRIGEGPHGGWNKGTEVEYELDGGRVFANAYQASRYFMRLNLRIPMTQALPWVSIYPEGGVQRFGKRLGLNREIQTGDAAFDDLAYIDTIATSDDDVLPLLTTEVRGAITKLLNAGYKVQFSMNGVEAFLLVQTGKPADTTQTAMAAAQLRTIANALPKATGGPYPATPRAMAIVPIVMLVGSWLGTVAVAALTHTATEQTFDDGGRGFAFLVLGGLGWVVYVLILAMLLRGRSYTFSLVLFGALFGLFCVPFSVGSAVLYANRALDASPAETHVVEVIRRSSYKSDFRLHFESWREPRGSNARREYVGVRRKDYYATAIGDRLTLSVHPGRFGWSWAEVVSIEHTATPNPNPTPNPTDDVPVPTT